jgi:hypothetical protein
LLLNRGTQGAAQPWRPEKAGMPQVTYEFRATTIATSANGDATPALFTVIGGAGGETLADWQDDDGATPLRAQSTGSGANDFTEHLIHSAWLERTSGLDNENALPANGEVVSVAVEMRGARTGGAGNYRTPVNGLRLKIGAEAYDDLTDQTSASTNFSTVGVAEISVAIEDAVTGQLTIERLRDPTLALQYRINHTNASSVGVHEPPTLVVVVNVPTPAPDPAAAVRGREWGGDLQVALRMVRGVWNAWCGIDSLFTDSYYPADNGNTSLIYGILNEWDVPFASYAILCAGQSGTNWGHLHTEAAPTNATLNRIAPGYSIAGGQPMEPTGLATGLFPCYVNLYEFTGNVADDASMLRDWILSASAATNFRRGDWTLGKAMTVTLITYNFADGATVQFQALRPFETDIENQAAVDTSDGVGFASTTLALTLDGTDTNVGSRVRATNDAANESGTFLAAVATHFKVVGAQGAGLIAAGVSGTSLQFHTTAAGNYTDAQLQALFAELGIDTVICCPGMNGGLNPDKATFKAHYQDYRDRCVNAMLANGVAFPKFIALSPYANESGTAADAVEMGEVAVEIAQENPYTFGVNLYLMGGEDTSDYRVDIVHTNHAGSNFMMRQVWGVMRRASLLALGGSARGNPDALRLGRRVV